MKKNHSKKQITKHLAAKVLQIFKNPDVFLKPIELDSIEIYLCGYTSCDYYVNNNTIRMDGFREYIFEIKQWPKLANSIMWIIRNYEVSDESAYANYQSLFERYLKEAEIIEKNFTIQDDLTKANDIMPRLLERPGVFTGDENINGIKAFMDGYADRYHEIFGSDSFSWYQKFDKYIKEKYKAGEDENWSEVILASTKDRGQALEILQKIYNEFSTEVNSF